MQKHQGQYMKSPNLDRLNVSCFHVTVLTLTTTIQWASCQIRKTAGCACAGNAGNVFPRRQLQRKPLVSDPGMHYDTRVTHVPWCMSGSLTRGGGENAPGIPGACATRNITYLARGPCLRIAQVWSPVIEFLTTIKPLIYVAPYYAIKLLITQM